MSLINIVIPMAGRGSRFASTAERAPKPLIEVQPGRRMIDYVVEYLRLAEPHRFIFVCLAEHARDHRLPELLAGLAPGHELVLTDAITRGPAATALLAAPLLNPNDELLIAYCDCFFTADINAFLAKLRDAAADGGVLVYPSAGSMEAYGIVDPAGRVLRIVEKQVISGDAIAGLYYFRHAAEFMARGEESIAATPDDLEVFVSTVCNNLIAGGGHVLGQRIERHQRIEMGTPADLALSRFWLETHRPAAAAVGLNADDAPRRST
jgi:NDP-sugar pyrophosphorylase family protein